MKWTVNSLWSSQQLAWLDALGFQVYSRTTAREPHLQPESAPLRARYADRGNAPPSSKTVASISTRTVDHPHFSAQRSVSASSQTASPVTPVRPSSSIHLPDILQLAVFKASGQDPTHPDIAKLMVEWPLEVLRTDPNAKRALWPRLRRLRRLVTSQ